MHARDFALMGDLRALRSRGASTGLFKSKSIALYAYADGVLTLEVETTFANGRKFGYTVPCARVE